MSVTSVDRRPEHLYPVFRERLEKAQRAAETLVKAELSITDRFTYAETLRTQERQTYLYAQGRTRPGRKVTWIRSPRYHGIGLAADHVLKERGYQVPHRVWEILREETAKQGLVNPAWNAGDYGHVQWDPQDRATLTKAAAWVRGGFQQVTPKSAPDVRIFVNGELLPDGDGFLDHHGRTWVWVRPLADELRFVVAEVTTTEALLVATNWTAHPAEAQDQTGMDGFEKRVALHLQGGKGFVWLKSLEPFARTLTWDGPTRTAKIWD